MRSLAGSSPPSWESLRLDFCYSERLAKRMGLPFPPPSWVAVREVWLGEVVGRERHLHRFFVLNEEDLLRADGVVLRHLSGVASVRFALKVPPSEEVWRVDRDPVHPTATPDALWKRGHELLAVEYDVGYPKVQVREKLARFLHAYDGVVWGVPTPLRRSSVKALVPPERAKRVELIVAPW
jgi:hypothetical protein